MAKNKLIRTHVALEYLDLDPDSVIELKTKLDRRNALADKLMEESLELASELRNKTVSHKRTKEEMADVLEVLDTIRFLFEYSYMEVSDIQDDKYELKGGFDTYHLKVKRVKRK